MPQRIFVMAFAVVLFFNANCFGQEDQTSRSPSDIPVDQIKKATGNQSVPKPVAEGTAVTQPGCKSGKILGCHKRNGCGRLMGKLRSLLGRCCCR